MSDPLNSLNDSVATLAYAGVALGTMGMVRDMVRDTRQPRGSTPRKERVVYTKLTNRGKVKKISRSEYTRLTGKRMPQRSRKSILDDPFGSDW